MRTSELAEKISGATQRGEWWHGRCPAHDDQRESLSFTDGDRGIVVKCHAGCTIEQIAAALGLRVADFFFDSAHRNDEKPTQETVHDFRDERGELLYQEVRLYPKGFKQRRPDGRGGWIYNLDGVRRVLSRLPDLLGQQTVHIAEGPKDAERLWSLGLPATTNSGGAGKWSDELTKQLKAAGVERVIIFQDNDVAGEAHAQDVTQSCLAHGLTVTRVRLPGLPPLRHKHGEDISDWLDAGHTKHELVDLLAITPALAGPAGPHRTDVGNAQRFTLQHHADLRYCADWTTWLIWDETRWRRDAEHRAMQKAKHTASSIYGEISAWPEDDRKKVAGWAMRSESDARLRAMLNLAQSEPGMLITSSQFDTDPWLLNVSNGVIDLRTGWLHPHDRADLITKSTSLMYDPRASCSTWLAMLNRVFAQNDTLITFVQRALGYALSGDTSEQCFFLLHGTGANGKSTLMRAHLHVLGEYGRTTRPETFLAKRGDGIPNDVAALAGARCVVALESDEGRRLAEAFVKGATGGDLLSARFLHQEYFQFVPQFKLFLSTNHKPAIRGTDHAMWRRVRCIPFTVQIPEGEQDRHLLDKLHAEASGILSWLVEGCLAWQRGGLAAPQEVVSATATYRAEQDVLGAFLADRCMHDHDGRVTRKDLFAAYKEWADESGERHVLTEREFAAALRERDYVEKKVKGVYEWRGLRLRTLMDPGPDDAEARPTEREEVNLDAH